MGKWYSLFTGIYGAIFIEEQLMDTHQLHPVTAI